MTGVYFQDPETWSPPDWLDFADRAENVEPKDARYASPVHLHLSRAPDGRLTVHALAFPAHNLPDLDSSTLFLREFLQAFRNDLEGRASRSGSRPPGSAPGTGATLPRPGLPSSPSRVPPKREYQTIVNVIVLGPRDKGGYRVQEEGRPEGIITLGTPPSPSPEVNSRHDVWIKDDDPHRPQYEWIDPKKVKKEPPRRQTGRGPRRGF